jgi:transposase
MMKLQPRFEAKWYYNLSLDRLVPEDHLLRQIANAVDFSFIRPLCRPFYSHTGRPSVDPVVLFKMLLIGYLYGITSERRLARELSLNLAYRWFLGYDFDQPTPDHSVLSKARARFGPEVFEHFFRRSIDLCGEAGLLEEGPVYVDSTLIQASASVDSMVPHDERLQPPLSIEEYVNRLYTENDPAPEAEDNEPPPSESGRSPRRRQRGGEALSRPNQELQSKTDPEATLVNRPDFGRHLAYKAHIAVAGKQGQVITAAVATTGIEADEHLLAEVLWQHHRLSGLKLEAVVADAKYGTSFNFLYLGRLGLPAFIPLTRFGVMRKTSGAANAFSGCRRKTPTSVPPARSSADTPRSGAPSGYSTAHPGAAAPPVPSENNARHQAGKERFTAPGARSPSSGPKHCWPVPWVGSGLTNGKSTSREPSG